MQQVWNSHHKELGDWCPHSDTPASTAPDSDAACPAGCPDSRVVAAEPRYPDIVVELTGTNGNAFAVIGRVRGALRDHDIDPTAFLTDATSGDYNHLLATCMAWVTVE